LTRAAQAKSSQELGSGLRLCKRARIPASQGDIMRWMLALFALIPGLAWSPPAVAWGDSGHRIACEIALRNLTPTAQAAVTRLLGAHPAIRGANPLNGEYGWACTYPDHPSASGPGRRAQEHFIIYPRALAAVRQADGCGEAPICVTSAIAADLAILRAATATDLQRAAALVYLGHWFADAHQPLHVSFRDDLGGNEIGSSGLCTRSLHSTWDTCILQSRTLPGERSVEEVRALATSWNAQAGRSERRAWLRSEPWQWAAESYALTIDQRMGYCVRIGGSCQYAADRPGWATGQPKRSQVVDAAYVDWAMPVIQRRLTQAGIRLAHQLNLALDPAYRQ
jgi:hypothetical protein